MDELTSSMGTPPNLSIRHRSYASAPGLPGSRRLSMCLCVVAVAAAASCGESPVDDPMPVVDAATQTPPPPSAQDASPTDAGVTLPPDPAERCATGSLCLETQRLGDGVVPEGRLAVFWMQLNDDLLAPGPLVVYEEHFDPTVSRITIPLASIGPPSDPYLLCERACASTYECRCASELQIGLGLVAVVTDADDNGLITGTDLESTGVPIGIGGVVLVHGPSGTSELPEVLRRMFPDGVAPGLTPYKVERAHPFDTLVPPEPGEVFPLYLCTLDQSCELPFPNLS